MALFSGGSRGAAGGSNGLAAFAAASGNPFLSAAQCSAAATEAGGGACLSSAAAGAGGGADKAAAAASAVPVAKVGGSDSSSPDGGGDNDCGESGHRFRFSAGAAMLPHPEKVAKGGEDAFFVSDDGLTLGEWKKKNWTSRFFFSPARGRTSEEEKEKKRKLTFFHKNFPQKKLRKGVADGVGGWGELGIDAGEYARSLMLNCRDAAASATAEARKKRGGAKGDDTKSSPLFVDPKAVLTVGHSRTTAQGSATACVLSLDPRTGELAAANLGDSGFVVVGGGGGGGGGSSHGDGKNSGSEVEGRVAFKSPQQQHGFNFPFQLGAAGSASDSPADAEEFLLPTRPGDLVVVGTDGLFDNVFADEVARLASLSRARGDGPREAAEVVAAFARRRAADTEAATPFAVAAQAMGYNYRGGKMDDITVVVGFVEEEESRAATEKGGKERSKKEVKSSKSGSGAGATSRL